MQVVDVDTMRRLDRKTIESGIAGEVLMERAGTSVAKKAADILEQTNGRRVLALTGKGNNGGDGWVAARHLHKMGFEVRVLAVATDGLKGDALLNFTRARDAGVPTTTVGDINDTIMQALFQNTDIILDALLGTGAKGAPHSPYDRLIELANTASHPIVAVDIPSGVNGNSGEAPGMAITATATITFGYAKLGNILYPGRELAGELIVVDIGILPHLIDEEPIDIRTNNEGITELLPYRDPAGHKGTFGKGYILAGSPGMEGAAILAGKSFLRSGAGLVYLGMPKSVEPVISSAFIEGVKHPLPDVRKSGALSLRALGEIHKRLANVDTLIVGPGLGLHFETRDTVIRLIRKSVLPTVVDADGLNALSQAPDGTLGEITAPTVFTPHFGELSRLLKISIEEIEKERILHSQKWAKQLNSTLLIKGNPTVIAQADGTTWLNTTGNDALATAGAGDVLTGLIGGFIAQGLSPLNAARLGTHIHGRAGEIAAEHLGRRSVIAGDILDAVPDAILELES